MHYGCRKLPPCANCGKPNGGFMSSTEWNHDEDCCSDICGMRLSKRIENGMVNIKLKYNNYFNSFSSAEDNSDRIDNLRFRIKHLEK